jgi:hypothetical protein
MPGSCAVSSLTLLRRSPARDTSTSEVATSPFTDLCRRLSVLDRLDCWRSALTLLRDAASAARTPKHTAVRVASPRANAKTRTSRAIAAQVRDPARETPEREAGQPDGEQACDRAHHQALRHQWTHQGASVVSPKLPYHSARWASRNSALPLLEIALLFLRRGALIWGRGAHLGGNGSPATPH